MKGNARFLVGILSANGYDSRRQAVMATWGRDAVASPDVDLVFLIGDPGCTLPTRRENVVYLPCPDNYDSLPQKTRWFCLWALAHGGNWTHLLKCDDDTYVRIDRLIATPWTSAIVGCKDGNGDHFHGGAGYVISRDAAIAIAAHLTKETGYEDWLARDAVARVGMWFEHDDRFCFNKSRQPSPGNEQITCHYVSPIRMRLIHDSFRYIPADAKIAIPKTIHHIWLGDKSIPSELARYRETWRSRHPSWDMKLWTDDNLSALENQSHFNRLPTPAQRA